MPKGNTTDNDILKMTLKGTDPSWRSSGSVLYLALHIADPTASGTQLSSEANYSNYNRIGLTKATGWTDNGTNFTNAVLLQFPQCGASGNTVTYVSLGIALSGSGQILYSGQLNSPLAVANLIQPQFSINALTITES